MQVDQLDGLSLRDRTASRVFGGVRATEDGAPAANHPDDPQVILGNALNQAASVGRRVRVKIGSDVTMAEFPSGGAVGYPDPVAWKASGGFSGAIADTQVGLAIGDLIEIEVHFDGGAGLFLIDRLTERVA